MNKWEVQGEEKGARLLFFLQTKLNKKVSNKALKRILEKGLCKVNSKIERFASISLKVGDIVEIDPSWKNYLFEETKIDLKVIYEDDYFVVVNKPPNFVCEDKNLHKFFPEGYLLVHRLDRETSGALLIAKNAEIKAKIIELFKKGQIKKYYLAIVDGVVKYKSGVVTNPIVKCSKEGRLVCKESSKGVFAKTSWRLIKTSKNFSLLLCELLTGRSHQLRLHLKGIKHPILGDYHYTRKFIYPQHVNRVMLHSYKISFPHPFYNNKMVEVIAYIFPDFEKLSGRVGASL